MLREKFDIMAQIVKLAPTEELRDLFAKEGANLFKNIDVLKEVETDGVEPLYTLYEGKAVTRADDAVRHAKREQVFANAPAANEEFFIVPKIV